MPKKPLRDGWTFDRYAGAILHFRHIESQRAADRVRNTRWTWIVETINHTMAKGDPGHVHLNHYYAENLAQAIGLAAHLQANLQEVWEDIVNIRPATVDEALNFERAEAELQLEPKVIPHRRWKRDIE